MPYFVTKKLLTLTCTHPHSSEVRVAMIQMYVFAVVTVVINSSDTRLKRWVPNQPHNRSALDM